MLVFVGPNTSMIRFAKIALLILCIGNGLRAQSGPPTQALHSPEEGFISRSKYTNAFFGFSLPIPQDGALQGLSLPSRDPSWHFLFGLKFVGIGFTTFTITAVESDLASSEDARKAAASGPRERKVERIEIGGKEFWKSESQDKTPGGKLRTLKYATASSGYVVEFTLISFDKKLTRKFKSSIESLTFFEPAKAREMAGADSQPYNPALAAPQSSGSNVPMRTGRIKGLSPGAVSGNIYTNDTLGLSYQFPVGWHLADKATQEKVIEAGHEAAWGSSPSAAAEHEVWQECSRVLLYTTKYPEDTRTEDVNPLIVISAFDPDCVPGAEVPEFPTSSDDEESIRQIGQGLVDYFPRTPLVRQGSMQLATSMAQGHLFLHLSGVIQVSVPGRSTPVKLHNSIVITSVNDFWVMWGFSSGSEAGLQELKDTKIKFSAASKAP